MIQGFGLEFRVQGFRWMCRVRQVSEILVVGIEGLGHIWIHPKL